MVSMPYKVKKWLESNKELISQKLGDKRVDEIFNNGIRGHRELNFLYKTLIEREIEIRRAKIDEEHENTKLDLK